MTEVLRHFHSKFNVMFYFYYNNNYYYYDYLCGVLSGAYFCMNMVLITLSTFIAVVIIQTHIRGDRKNKVPPWLKRVRSLYHYLSVLEKQIQIFVNN